MDIKDKAVLVTGASAGIGEAIALEMARRGARLALVRRDSRALGAVAERCSAHGRPALPIVADLATDAGCEFVVKRTLEHFNNRLDVLVNNAGITARSLLENADMATFDSIFDVNVRAVYNLTRLLLPALLAAKGNVVNVSSVAGSAVCLGSLAYSMSKAALNHFTNLIALELTPKGVRVNAVTPGVTVSKIIRRITGYDDEQYEAYLTASARTIPTGRVCAATEVAEAVLWLAAPGNVNVTGVDIPVDGGARQCCQLLTSCSCYFFQNVARLPVFSTPKSC